jgi:hypothetical protein
MEVMMTSEQPEPIIEQPEITSPKKHSILGIISLALVLLSVFLCIATVLSMRSSWGVNEVSATEGMVNRLLIICMLGLNPIALIFGIIALRQKNTNKAFAITGSVLSVIGTCLTVITILLAVLGVAYAVIRDY